MKKLLIATAVATAFSAGAQADVRINGFANLIAGKASSDDTLYGYTDDVSFSEESLFAIQLSGDINEKMTATGQLVARGSDDYSVDFEWAYLTYAATDNVSVSAGRLRLPLFRYSASLDVGYSYHWVSAPSSVYSVPFNNIDGVRVDYSNFAGDLEYTFQLSAGAFENDFEAGGQRINLKGDNIAAVTGEFTYGNWKLRGVAGRGDITFGVAALAPVIGQLAMISPALADLLDVNDDAGRFLGVGLEYDNFDWFVSGELTSVTIDDSYYPDDTESYITAGMRFGKYTPYVTVEWSDREGDYKFLDQVAGLPQPYQVPATQIIAGAQQGWFTKGKTYVAGLRYDYDTNIALKADVSSYKGDLTDDEDAVLVRFAVNYVF